MYCDWKSVPRHVGEFLLPILEENGPTKWSDSKFTEVKEFLNGKFAEKWIGRGELSLGHLRLLTLLPLIFYLAVSTRMLYTCYL
jgi:hypothetical protein